MMIRVNLRELITFYDSDPAVRQHASAIKAVAGEELNLAVLAQYFADRGESVTLNRICNTGNKNGRRLDAWLRIAGGKVTYYQVEVKSWSFHGYGGGPALAIEHHPRDGERVRKDWWLRHWDVSTKRFKQENLNKVLAPMKRPDDADDVRPLACLWAPLHPVGAAEPFFDVSLSDTDEFDRVWVFSVSTYLRECLKKDPFIELWLPETMARLEHLGRMFMVVTPS